MMKTMIRILMLLAIAGMAHAHDDPRDHHSTYAPDGSVLPPALSLYLAQLRARLLRGPGGE